MLQCPTQAQVEQWEKLVDTTFPDQLVDELCQAEVAQAQWAAVLEHLGAAADPGPHTAVLLSALAAWLVSVWPLVDELLPGQLDMLFPVLIAARHQLTLRTGQAVISGYPAFVRAQWGQLAIGAEDAPEVVNLKLGMGYTNHVAEACACEAYRAY
jgi:hypothetical protein